MKPLLEITTTPIELEYKIARAQLKAPTYTQPVAHITRQRGGGFEVQVTRGELRVDTLETRRSAGIRSSPMVMEDASNDGKQKAAEATQRYLDEGNRMIKVNINADPFSEIAANRSTPQMHPSKIAFIPSVRPSVTVTPSQVSINYTPDKLQMDWETMQGKRMEYVPGEFNINILRYPQINIKYLGDPIYVPPSSNPNYVPVDVKI